MDLIYQKNQKFKPRCFLFIIDINSLINMLYLKHTMENYKSTDFVAIVKDNLNFNKNNEDHMLLTKSFNVIYKTKINIDFDIFSEFIKKSEYKIITFFFDNFIKIPKSSDIEKKKILELDVVYKDIIILNNSIKKSILKNFVVIKNTYLKIKVGSKDSSSRNKIIETMKKNDINTFSSLILLSKTKIGLINNNNSDFVNNLIKEEDKKILYKKYKKLVNIEENEFNYSIKNFNKDLIMTYGYIKERTKSYENIIKKLDEKIKLYKQKMSGKGIKNKSKLNKIKLNNNDNVNNKFCPCTLGKNKNLITK